MKIAVVADTHWGIRNDNQVILHNNKKFVNNVFIPSLKEQNIKEVIHLGDLVDRRKYINFYTSYCLRSHFIEPLLKEGINFRLIVGNHDMFFRNRMDINIGSELFEHYDSLPTKKGFTGSFYYYTKPIELCFDGTNILFMPWICDSNRDLAQQKIAMSGAQILFGHLELLGFEMYRGMLATHGEDPSVYSRFDIVGTGHYHHKSSIGNIHYLGSHSQFIWSDYNDPRGFHIFDTKTRDFQFIENPYRLFEKVFYDDSNEAILKEENFSKLKDKYVKVVVRNCDNAELYDWYLARVEESQPIDTVIVQDHLNLDQVQDESIVSETKTTLEIIRDYIASVNTMVDSVKLDLLLTDLYNEALSIET